MPGRNAALLVPVLACLVCAAVAGAATKPPPVVEPLSQPVRGAAKTPRTAATCIPGAPGPGVFTVDYVLPPHDRYYTLVQCAACGADSVAIPSVHVAMLPACDVVLRVNFVGARGDSTCWEPDTTVVLSAPEEYVWAESTPGSHVGDRVLATPVHVLGPVFLCVDFVRVDGSECALAGTRPWLITNGTCAPCRSWNDSVAGRQELCRVLLPGQPVMYVDFETCTVPAVRTSWGALKLRYR